MKIVYFVTALQNETVSENTRGRKGFEKRSLFLVTALHFDQ